MWNITGLILFAIALWALSSYLLHKNFLKAQRRYLDVQDKFAELIEENTRIERENFNLGNIADENIALYDITRELCKSLDEEKVFAIFKDQLHRYTGVSGCSFIRDSAGFVPGSQETVLPLKIDKHTLGYLVAAKIKPEDSEKFQILSQQFLLGIKRAILYQKVQALSITDGLTGVFSRRYCLERFREEVERSKKFKHNFSFLMIDVDYFKNYNDKYGHLVGDAILREVAATIKENIRQIDLLGRYGGEEFILVLTETGSEQSKFVAERIRKAVEEKQIKVYDENLGITISIGVATFPKDAEVPQAIIEKADQALYCAKEAGRNRVCLYPAKAA